MVLLKKKLIVSLIISLLCASASAFYEDFATTGDQYTLYGDGSVTSGQFTGSGAIMDGTYAAGTAGSPLTYKATFNMAGDSSTWANCGIGFSSSSATGFGSLLDGWIIMYVPNLAGYGSYTNATFDLLYNPNTNVWTDVYWNGGASNNIPGGFDLNADYELILIDSGDSMDFWV